MRLWPARIFLAAFMAAISMLVLAIYGALSENTVLAFIGTGGIILALGLAEWMLRKGENGI